MIAKIYILSMCVFALLQSSCAEKKPQLGKDSIDQVVAAMTLSEKALLLIGTGMAGFGGDVAVVGQSTSIIPGAAGTTHAIERLGIPAIVLADGPAGLRINPIRENDDNTYYCTAFPVGTLLASTWNTELVEQVGAAMGKEVLEYGCDVLLAPALNIHRNPLCGRNFEYYSEDPIISGKIASAMTRGVQNNGVGVSLKHYSANNQETNRMANDSRVSVRALREIYLKGFEIAVKESNPWTIMSSYNYLNGIYTSENYDLQTTILREEWGFKGTVMTDWFGGANTSAQVRAGNDLLMPGSSKQKDSIVQAVKNGELDEADVDVNVKRILQLVLLSPTFNKYNYSNKPDLKAHAIITRQSAAEGMVLLKNSKGTLPLSSTTKNIAAYGITSYDFIAGGTGSGDVNKAYTISLSEGLANAGYTLDSTLTEYYTRYLAEENKKNIPDPNDKFAAFMPKVRPAELLPTKEELIVQATTSDAALITIGRTSGEFMDRTVEGDFELTKEEQKLIESVSKAFQSVGKKVVVILNIGGVIETSSWKDTPDAILLAWQAGQEGGNSVADVLCGKVNPSGRLTMTFPVNFSDASSSKNFPIDISKRQKDSDDLISKKISTDSELIRNIDYTIYEEDIYVGYRYFDTFDKKVAYPFGYGLSYTTFEYKNPQIKEDKGIFTITVEVKNNGIASGKEVIQVYASAPKSVLNKPFQELKAFAKTKELKSGESQKLTFTISASELASFDDNLSSWITEKGTYQFSINTSSRDVKAILTGDVVENISVKTNDVLKPQEVIASLNE